MPKHLKGELDEPDDATPLDDDEIDGLIPSHVHTRYELNQWEATNLASGQAWALARKSWNPLSARSLQQLHRRMFGNTWTWAGTFRRSDRNISPYHWTQVGVLVQDLVDNTKTQYDASDKGETTLDDIAVRFHHQLVRIHPWPNGNGRHARLATDLLLKRWGRPPFAWGSEADLATEGQTRATYIAALRAADGGSFDRLRKFVRS
jgi:Fic-DOC domain mobile mystery protein B